MNISTRIALIVSAFLLVYLFMAIAAWDLMWFMGIGEWHWFPRVLFFICSAVLIGPAFTYKDEE